MNDLHIDLETLDTIPSSQITEIGAVCGDSEFHVDIDLRSYDRHSEFSFNGDTYLWALANTPRAFEPSENRLGIISAVAVLIQWLKTQEYDEVWACAPSFDCIILQHHFRVLGFDCPWDFWKESDVRTTKRNAGLAGFYPTEYKNDHNALQDAKNQRDCVNEIKAFLESVAARKKDS